MTVEIYEDNSVATTKAVVEILTSKDEYIPTWEFHFPERESLTLTEIIALHEALFEAASDLDKIIGLIIKDNDADGEV